MFKKVQKGFTLIELMIVVAIIGILAAIAIPAYQNYTIRAQVTEGLSLADGWKTALSEFYSQNGVFPTTTTPTAANASNTVMYVAGASFGKYVSGITAAGGTITVTYSNVSPYGANKILNGATLAIAPYLNTNNDIVWVCGSESVPGGATLATNATSAAAGTTIATQYLPGACHA
jgi:type IV pilus assembly protein PilA